MDPLPPDGRLGSELVRCDQCGDVVPAATFCVRCGDPLGPELRWGRAGRVRDSFAAAPHERAFTPRVVSTLFPALPRAHMRTFRLGLAAGVAVIVGLAVLGLYPLAIVAAAILVPLLSVIYVYDVDVYEDEPVRIVALTFGWGVMAGGLFAVAVDALVPTTIATSGIGSVVAGVGRQADPPVVRGVLLPVLGGLLMVLGPLALSTQRRFDDVLDGATFGVAAAVAFVGAQTLVTASAFLDAGLRPAGDPVPWACPWPSRWWLPAPWAVSSAWSGCGTARRSATAASSAPSAYPRWRPWSARCSWWLRPWRSSSSTRSRLSSSSCRWPWLPCSGCDGSSMSACSRRRARSPSARWLPVPTAVS